MLLIKSSFACFCTWAWMKIKSYIKSHHQHNKPTPDIIVLSASISNLLIVCAVSFCTASCLSPWQWGKGCDKQEHHDHIHDKLNHYPFLRKLNYWGDSLCKGKWFNVCSSIYTCNVISVSSSYCIIEWQTRLYKIRSPVGSQEALLSWILANSKAC